MASEIKSWEIVNEGLIQIDSTLAENNRKETEHLEEWIKTKPEILGNDILIIGQQIYTKSGPLDFLGIDDNGNLVIVELKRGKLPREALAQAIDYASDLSNWEIDKISEVCISYRDENLEDALTNRFEEVEIEDVTINENQRILLVGFNLSESLSRMIEWLSNNFDVGINAVILNYSKTSSGNEILSRTVSIPEEIAKQKSNKKKFTIDTSDEPGDYEKDKLLDLLKKYLGRSSKSSSRIKTILLPALLKHDKLSRNQLKEEFVKNGEAPDESMAGKYISLISQQLGHAKKDYLRQIINYEYPNHEWEKDNFSIRDDYRDLVKKLLSEVS